MAKSIRPACVAVYIRWSTEDQGEGTTLAVQSEACHHYVQSQGWQIRDDLVFIDDGYSGGSLDRPALTDLRSRVQAQQVDCVVVFKLDRLSRSVVDTVNLVLQEWDGVTYVKSAREPIDTTSSMGKQFFYMLVSYAEWERNVIRERTFSGKLRRAREGRSPGMPPPYGYRRGDAVGALAVHDPEAEVVRLIFTLAEHGGSVRQIALHLNQHGFAASKGGRWGPSTVSKLLHNPIYTGSLVWGRRQVNPRYGKVPGERRLVLATPHVVCDSAAAVPAIVARTQFDQVQLRLSKHASFAPGARVSSHLLSGLVRCGQCGGTMQYNSAARWSYYRCAGRLQGHACTAPSVPAHPLEAAIVDCLLTRYAPFVQRQADALTESARAKATRQWETAGQSVQAALNRMRAQEQRVTDDYLLGRLSASDRDDLLTQLRKQRDDLVAQAADTQSRLQSLRAPPEGSTAPLDKEGMWGRLSPNGRQLILRELVAEVKAVKISRTQLDVAIVWVGGPCNCDGTSSTEAGTESKAEPDAAACDRP